jgi:hypothetical protein
MVVVVFSDQFLTVDLVHVLFVLLVYYVQYL